MKRSGSCGDKVDPGSFRAPSVGMLRPGTPTASTPVASLLTTIAAAPRATRSHVERKRGYRNPIRLGEQAVHAEQRRPVPA